MENEQKFNESNSKLKTATFFRSIANKSSKEMRDLNWEFSNKKRSLLALVTQRLCQFHSYLLSHCTKIVKK